jgi:hypothetical protein
VGKDIIYEQIYTAVNLCMVKIWAHTDVDICTITESMGERTMKMSVQPMDRYSYNNSIITL